MSLIWETIIEYKEYIILSIVLTIYAVIDFFLRRKNKILKKNLYEKYHIIEQEEKDITDIDEIDDSDQLEYYKNKNFISILRFLLAFVIIISYILHQLPNFFSFFAIAMGAVVITFKEVILSFVGFFYVSTQYKIGDEIIFGDISGEILSLNMLNVGLVGLDENGESNGQFSHIPNYKFFTESIKREEIGLHKFKKNEVVIPYSKENFKDDFDVFLEKLTLHLDETLPKRTISNIGNFKTYLGFRYKLKFEYNEKEILLIKIRFIARTKIIQKRERDIFLFVESLKK